MVSLGELVLLDTDVWSHLYARGRRVDARVALWRGLLVGKTVAIAAQKAAQRYWLGC